MQPVLTSLENFLFHEESGWGILNLGLSCFLFYLFFIYFFNFIFKLYIIVLVLPNIKMNPPQVYMCSPCWTLLPPPSPYHPSGSSKCTSPKHPVSCIEPGLATRFKIIYGFKSDTLKFHLHKFPIKFTLKCKVWWNLTRLQSHVWSRKWQLFSFSVGSMRFQSQTRLKRFSMHLQSHITTSTMRI